MKINCDLYIEIFYDLIYHIIFTKVTEVRTISLLQGNLNLTELKSQCNPKYHKFELRLYRKKKCFTNINLNKLIIVLKFFI